MLDIKIPPSYFPSVAVMAAISVADTIALDIGGNYQKQSFRNRAQILMAEGVKDLSVPINHNKLLLKPKLNEIEINYAEKWPVKHWRSIQTAYGKSAYFPYYEDSIRALLLDTQYQYLYQLNIAIMTKSLMLFKLNKHYSVINDVLYGKAQDLEAMLQKHYQPLVILGPYYQHFSGQNINNTSFAPNLSSLDLLLQMGPRAKDYLEKTGKQLFSVH